MTEHLGRTERLVISRMSLKDAEGLHDALAGPEVTWWTVTQDR